MISFEIYILSASICCLKDYSTIQRSYHVSIDRSNRLESNVHKGKWSLNEQIHWNLQSLEANISFQGFNPMTSSLSIKNPLHKLTSLLCTKGFSDWSSSTNVDANSMKLFLRWWRFARLCSRKYFCNFGFSSNVNEFKIRSLDDPSCLRNCTNLSGNLCFK